MINWHDATGVSHFACVTSRDKGMGKDKQPSVYILANRRNGTL